MVEQVSIDKNNTADRITAKDILKLISGIRKHIENDQCRCCKIALLNIFSTENVEANSLENQSTEPAEVAEKWSDYEDA